MELSGIVYSRQLLLLAWGLVKSPSCLDFHSLWGRLSPHDLKRIRLQPSALSDIIPLRDIFGLLFFTSIGMLLDPSFLLEHWRIILMLVLLVAFGKGIIFAALARLFKYGNVVPLAVSLGLFQSVSFLSCWPGPDLQANRFRTRCIHWSSA